MFSNRAAERQPHGSLPSEIHWGAPSPEERGPLVTTLEKRNVIGTHSGSYMVYKALAVAAGKLDPEHKPDLNNTSPVAKVGPFPSWKNPERIVSLDPWGATVQTDFSDLLAEGWDIRPTIAITQAHIELPELKQLIQDGTIKPDGKILLENGTAFFRS